MPLSSFAPLAGLVQGLDAWTKYQTDQQNLQDLQQQQQVLQGLWPSLQQYPGAGLQQQTPPPIQPSQLTAPQPPQTPYQPPYNAPIQAQPLPPIMPPQQSPGLYTGGFGASLGDPLSTGQPAGLPSPLYSGGFGAGFGAPIPALTSYGGAAGISGQPGSPSGLGVTPQQAGLSGPPADADVNMLSMSLGLPPGGQAGGMPNPYGAMTQQVAPSGGTTPSSGTAGVSPLSPFVDPNSPYGQAGQAGSGAPYSQQPLPQPGTSAQQPQAPGPVYDPTTSQPPQQLLPPSYGDGAGGGAAGLFQSTIVPLESGGNMNIGPGSYGEIGPAQILPETFRAYARPGEDIYNNQDNLNVGLRYANDLWTKSGGDWKATLVGYNRGEGAMRTFQASGDDPRSVNLAPQYRQAVGGQRGGPQQAYAESSAHITASTSPQEKAHADAGARNILGQMPNPLAFAGRIEIPQLVQAIDRGNPNASDAVKSGIFMKLYPMLSKVSQDQYTALWDQYKQRWEEYKYEHPHPKLGAPENYEITTPGGQPYVGAAEQDENTGRIIDPTTQQPFPQGTRFKKAPTQEQRPDETAPENYEYIDSSGETQTAAAVYDKRRRQLLNPISGQPLDVKPGTIPKRVPTQDPYAPSRQGYQPVEITNPDGTKSTVWASPGRKNIPISPGGGTATRIPSGGGGARSPQGMFAQQWAHEHPTATADEFSRAMANYRYSQAVSTAFGSGIVGRNLDSLNTVADHILRVKQYADALNNGQIPVANRIANAIARESGKPEVTSFELGRDVMADEVVRLLTATGGTEADRQTMQSRIATYDSPPQFAGIFNDLIGLTGGRFRALELHWSGGDPARAKEFEEQHMTPEARAVFRSYQAAAPDYSWLQVDPDAAGAGGGAGARPPGGGGTAPPPGSAGDQTRPLPPGAAQDDDGTGYEDDQHRVWVKVGNQLVLKPGATPTPGASQAPSNVHPPMAR